MVIVSGKGFLHIRERVRALLAEVGLPSDIARKNVCALSGGQ